MTKLQLACRMIVRPYSLRYIEYFVCVAILFGDIMFLGIFFSISSKFFDLMLVAFLMPVLFILYGLGTKLYECNQRNISGFAVSIVFCGVAVSMFHDIFIQTIIGGCVLMIIVLFLDSVLGKKAYIDPVSVYYKEYLTYKSINWTDISSINVDTASDSLRITPMGLHPPSCDIIISNGSGYTNKTIWDIIGWLNVRIIRYDSSPLEEDSLGLPPLEPPCADEQIAMRETKSRLLPAGYFSYFLKSNGTCFLIAAIDGLLLALLFFINGTLSQGSTLKILLVVSLATAFILLLFTNVYIFIRYLIVPKDAWHYLIEPQYQLFALLIMVPGVVMAAVGPVGATHPVLHWTISLADIIFPLLALLFMSKNIFLTPDGICSQSVFFKTVLHWNEITKAEMRFAYRSSLVLEGDGKIIELGTSIKDWHLLVPEIVSRLTFKPQWLTDLVSNPDEIPEVQETPNIP